ncbi:hypothetical protein CXR04_16665 [Streptomyces sp. CMB-StM0423]|nr:hypothetical protein CXR04_16665 [Streptomyces sp. CMB-StM0423]
MWRRPEAEFRRALAEDCFQWQPGGIAGPGDFARQQAAHLAIAATARCAVQLLVRFVDGFCQVILRVAALLDSAL